MRTSDHRLRVCLAGTRLLVQSSALREFLINRFYVCGLGMPFGGARKSGIGGEGAQHRSDFYCGSKPVSPRA